MGGGISIVSPYLNRPLRSLREALRASQAPSQRHSDSTEARPTEARPTEARPTEARPAAGLLGGTAAPDARAEAVPPLAPRRLFTVVAGGLLGTVRGHGGA